MRQADVRLDALSDALDEKLTKTCDRILAVLASRMRDLYASWWKQYDGKDQARVAERPWWRWYDVVNQCQKCVPSKVGNVVWGPIRCASRRNGLQKFCTLLGAKFGQHLPDVEFEFRWVAAEDMLHICAKDAVLEHCVKACRAACIAVLAAKSPEYDWMTRDLRRMVACEIWKSRHDERWRFPSIKVAADKRLKRE